MADFNVLVPNGSVERVKKTVGALPSVSYSSTPRRQSFVLTLSRDWETEPSRARVAEVLYPMARGTRVFVLAEGKSTLNGPAVQAITHWALKLAQEPFVGDVDAFRRIALARRARAEKVMFSAAALEGDRLVAWNCEPVRFEAQTSLIPALASMKPEELEKFEIDGTTLRWPKHDVDLSVETIRYASEPKFRAQQDAATRRDANRYAAAMKRVRLARGLKQRDFAGLSERQVRRLENGDSVPHADTLRLLAAAFGISVNEYMLELAEANE